ncbi:uncharacterized protein [Arachis hypogaea]|uniref:uncharacterized protein n=1 Tax=Arachis hypogaea TaxID=3818 RepID=UPI003B228491
MLTAQDKMSSEVPKPRIPDITFTSKDFETKVPNLNDLVVILVTTGTLLIRKVLLDQGSSVDVMFLSTFKKMQLNEKVLQPSSGELVGFSGERVPVTGRPSLKAFGAIVSTIHLCVKFCSEEGTIAIVYSDIKEARQCYNVGLKMNQAPMTRTNSVYNTNDIPELAKLDPRVNHDQRPTPIDDLKKILSFVDAYSGYNQILMHPSDEDKIAFITDHGNFYYKVMPFGLKNAGATYQRLMDNAFQKQIGKNMEVYVDDIVVKLDTQESIWLTLKKSSAN